MRRPFFLIALALTACQPQAGAHDGPQATQSPSAPAGDLIYVQDPNGPRMLEMDWAGKVHGSVSARGFSTPSPDGSRFFRATDHIVVEDWRGNTLGALDADATSYGLGTWADDGQHVCGISFPPNAGPDTGTGSLWTATPGEKRRTLGPVGKPGSNPAVLACSIKSNRAIVAGGLEPHWPPGATRYLITGDIQTVNLTTGAIEYEHQYPLGNMGGQRETGERGDWVLVAASPDGRYLAEAGVFNGKTAIREVPTGKVLATMLGSVRGFSWDGSRVAASLPMGNTTETQVISWAEQRVIWRGSGVAQAAVARPDSADLLIGRAAAAGDWYDQVIIAGDGTWREVVRNGSVVG